MIRLLIFLLPLLCSSQMVINSYIHQAVGGVPVVESSTTKEYTSDVTSIVLDKPSGVVSGDLLLALIGSADNFGVTNFDDTSDPAGWTFVHENGWDVSDTANGVFWKVAGGSEPSTYTFTQPRANQVAAFLLRISGQHTTPIGVQGTEYEAIATVHTVTGITTGNANSLAIAFVNSDGRDTGPISVTGFTEQNETTNSASAQGTVAIWADKEMVSTGATGNAVFTLSVSDGAAGRIFEIRSE